MFRITLGGNNYIYKDVETYSILFHMYINCIHIENIHIRPINRINNIYTDVVYKKLSQNDV